MIAASPQQQRRLLDLQHVDTAIRQLEHKRANLPEQQALDENQATLRSLAAEYAEATEQLEDQQTVQRTRERDIANLDARRKAEEARLYSGEISSEKQVQAIRGELSSIRQKKNDYEDELLEAMERIEELEARVASLTERHTRLKGKIDELTAARDEAAGDLDGELEHRRAERQQVVADVEPALVKIYEEVRGRQGGTAVAELKDTSCQGCFLELTPIELEEVREEAKTAVPRCPQCDRLLVVGS